MSLQVIPTDLDLLDVLKSASNEDLEPLVRYILGGPEKADSRVSSELEMEESYKQNYPNHKIYHREIAAEIQLFGGQTFINIFRGTGVAYKEIVCDVADKLSVNYSKTSSVAEIENQIILKVIEKSYEKMSQEEKEKFLEEIGIDKSLGIPAVLPIAAVQALIKATGFLAYRLAVIVANAVARQMLGRGLALGANAGLTRAIGVFAGPIGWIITGLWTLFDIGSPAYRVTIPCVLHIAFLRQQQSYQSSTRLCECEHRNNLNAKFCENCGRPMK